MTMIELTDEEAKLFLEFRKHQDAFKKMVDQGVFEPNTIQAILYFNKFSVLATIDKTNRIIYK